MFFYVVSTTTHIKKGWKECVSEDEYFRHFPIVFHSLAQNLVAMEFVTQKIQWMRNKLDKIVITEKRHMQQTGE